MEAKNIVDARILEKHLAYYPFGRRAQDAEISTTGRLDELNDSVREKLGEEYALEVYSGRQVETISEETFDEIARCYMTVFNESWGESWTIESAKKEVKDSLHWDSSRIPLLSLLYKDDTIIGFCWVVLLSKDQLCLERDMPWELSQEQKLTGMETSNYWLEQVVKKEKIMFIKELGALKEHRQKVTPFLCVPLFEQALEQGYDVAFLWTNVNSKAFKWGLGVGFSPVHFFITQNLLLMYGSVKGSVDIFRSVVNASFSKKSQYNMIQNINKYLMKGELRR
ncbi:MAG: hypothetical protein R3332_06325 [Pseudohongiellaceae bacterium]|nr:hypothetical protein [Pseudohongiellaceae bacterium]